MLIGRRVALVLTAALLLGSTAMAAPPGAKLLPVRVGERVGFVSPNGRMAIKAKFSEARSFTMGLAAVRTTDGLWGYINSRGRYLVKPRFERAHAYSNGLALTSDSKEGRCEWLNLQGKVAVKYQSFGCGAFRNGLAPVLVGDKWGFIDFKGRLVLQPRWGRVHAFSEGRARVLVNGSYGFIDTAGRAMVKTKYHDAHDFSGGLAAVLTDDGWGFVNKRGRWKIKPRYNDVARGGFQSGLAAVEVDGRWGYITPRGRMAIKPTYYLASAFSEGRAAVMFDKLTGLKTGYINIYGSLVVKAAYDQGDDFDHSLAVVSAEDRSMVITRSGKVIFDTANPTRTAFHLP